MSWWETLHLVTWWKRLGISAIKTGQDAPSWIWCTERLSFFGRGHIVLQRFVHVRCHFQPLPTKLVFAYFDRGSCVWPMLGLTGTILQWHVELFCFVLKTTPEYKCTCFTLHLLIYTKKQPTKGCLPQCVNQQKWRVWSVVFGRCLY